jgi:cytochrome P450
MASLPLEAPKQWTTSPRAVDALDAALKANPQVIPHHTEKWDVSRSDIYVEDRWQPIFAEMRAAGDLHKVTDSPFKEHWNVVSHRAIQHIEALPELYSSEGGITILERLSDEELADLNRERFELPMFIAMDRPKHTGQRRTVAPKFTPSNMGDMEAEIRARTGELLDTLPRRQVFDWVDTVSIELTTGMLALLSTSRGRIAGCSHSGRTGPAIPKSASSATSMSSATRSSRKWARISCSCGWSARTRSPPATSSR